MWVRVASVGETVGDYVDCGGSLGYGRITGRLWEKGEVIKVYRLGEGPLTLSCTTS